MAQNASPDIRRVSYEYRGISHVKDLQPHESEEEFQAQVRAKYERLSRKKVAPAGVQTVTTVPQQPVYEEDYTGNGTCPYCGKEFKRLDMHVSRCQQGPEVKVE